MLTGKLFIGGRWVDGSDTFVSINPSTNSPLGVVYQATQEEVNAAVSAARQALAQWKGMDVVERAKIVGRVVDILVERYGEEGKSTPLKKLIVDEVGKPFPEADIEVIESSDMLAFFVNNAPKLLSPKTLRLNQDLWPTKSSQVVYEPVGVVGVIKAWNYPLEIPLWAIGPALVAGNTVVFKPSEHAPFVGLEIGKMFEEAGLPEGVLNIVTGDGVTGRMLVHHKDVNMIAFTGSVQVGREIAIHCAEHFKRYTLELSGNDAAIVDENVDLELAANGLVWGAFCNTGQVCVGIKRVFVHKNVADRLIPLLVEKTKALRLGIEVGPIVSLEQLEKVNYFVNDARSKGAEILVGGAYDDGKEGFWYQPTVLTKVTEDMALMQDECFGPLLPVVVVSSIEEGIEMANRSRYGLGASVWTSDLERGQKIARSLDVGMVWVNDVNVAYPEAPWVGRKQSGHGVELSEWGLYEYVQLKHINVETSNEKRRAWWYPYSLPK